MTDIRSALAAAMHSQADPRIEDTEPVERANDERIDADAAQPEQSIRRSGQRGRERRQSGPHNSAAITSRAQGYGRDETGQGKSEPVNRGAPRNWNRADREAFKGLPESAQDFILRQCRSIETELGKKSEHLAAFHREYEPVAKMLEPFAGRLKELNLTPRAAIQRYIDIERRLATGDGVAVIKALVDGYNVAPDQLLEALGSKSSDAQLAPVSYPTQLNRQVPADATRHADALHDFQLQLDQFKTAQDAAGNPLHPHYEDVEPEMAARALAYSTRGQTIPPLKELYHMAVSTNPVLRKSPVAAKRVSDEASLDTAPKPRIALARKPLSNGMTASQPKRVFTRQSPGRSLRDEILAQFDGA
jgi:hypothetical protein